MKKEYSRKSWFCNLLCIIILLSSTVRISIANEPNSVPFAVNHIAGELKRAFDTRNYKILRKYISKKHKIYWGICYVNGDLFSEFSSFSEFNNKLMRESKDTTIIIKGKPVWIDDLKLWRIKTEGWAGEEPFMDFSLEYEDSQLVLAGICTSAKPDP
ncbi:MAG: hypothetical protein ONB05_10470, partial [candidate division KSB1 bacterium]|nr:hypothetical protein [candidate division KSB1 bacterium]